MQRIATARKPVLRSLPAVLEAALSVMTASLQSFSPHFRSFRGPVQGLFMSRADQTADFSSLEFPLWHFWRPEYTTHSLVLERSLSGFIKLAHKGPETPLPAPWRLALPLLERALTFSLPLAEKLGLVNPLPTDKQELKGFCPSPVSRSQGEVRSVHELLL